MRFADDIDQRNSPLELYKAFDITDHNQIKKEMEKGTIEQKLLNKTIKKVIRRVLREYEVKIIYDTIGKNKNMKVLRPRFTNGNARMYKLKNMQGVMTTNL